MREDGFVRAAIIDGRLVSLEAGRVRQAERAAVSLPSVAPRRRPFLIYAVVDRLAAGSASDSRLRDSLETAFAKGQGRCYAFVNEER